MSTTEKSKKRCLEKIAPEQDPVRSPVRKRGRVGVPAQGHATEPAAARLTTSNRARDERAEKRSRLTQQAPRAASRSRAAHRASTAESTEPSGAASSQEQMTDSVEQGRIEVVKEALGVAKEAYTLVLPAGKDLELAASISAPRSLTFCTPSRAHTCSCCR